MYYSDPNSPHSGYACWSVRLRLWRRDIKEGEEGRDERGLKSRKEREVSSRLPAKMLKRNWILRWRMIPCPMGSTENLRYNPKPAGSGLDSGFITWMYKISLMQTLSPLSLGLLFSAEAFLNMCMRIKLATPDY